MTITLDEFVIGGDTNYFITSIAGLGAAPIRTSSYRYAGRDGGKVTEQFYDIRQISIEGKIVSDTQTDHRTDRADLGEATPIGEAIPVYITDFDNTVYLIYCNVVDFKMEHLPGGKASDYRLELAASDPLFYDESAGLQSVVLDRVEAGGAELPFELPVTLAPGEQPTVVANSGNTIVYPTITLMDSAIDPVITNQTTGELVQLNLTMSDGDEVVIDMANRTVTLNGGNILANRDDTSSWWGLLPGDNNLILDSDSVSDDVTATVEWRSGVTSI